MSKTNRLTMIYQLLRMIRILRDDSGHKPYNITVKTRSLFAETILAFRTIHERHIEYWPKTRVMEDRTSMINYAVTTLKPKGTPAIVFKKFDILKSFRIASSDRFPGNVLTWFLVSLVVGPFRPRFQLSGGPSLVGRAGGDVCTWEIVTLLTGIHSWLARRVSTDLFIWKRSIVFAMFRGKFGCKKGIKQIAYAFVPLKSSHVPDDKVFDAGPVP